MTAGIRKRKKITEAQYLKMERAAESKHAFLDGEVIPFVNANLYYCSVARDAMMALYYQVKERGHELLAFDMRVKVPACRLYTYPSIAVVAGGAQFEDAETDTLLNPTLIADVYPRSRETYDRGKAFAQYQQLPSLAEYLLIAQPRCFVEHYLRQPDGKWLLSEYSDPNDVIKLPSIGCRLALSDVYDQVIVAVKEEEPTWNLSPLQEAR
jgi:Uma2 family endonuclease